MEKEKAKSVFRHYVDALSNRILWSIFIAVSFYLLSVLAGSVIAPLFYKGIIDAIAKGNQQLIIHFFWLMFAANLTQLVFSRIYEHINGEIMTRGPASISSYALSHLTEHPYQFFIDNFAGSLVNKMRKFVNAFERMFDIIITDFLYAFISIVGIVFVLFKTSVIIALCALAWFALFTFVIFFFTKKRLPLERERGNTESKVTGVLADIITNILNLKIFSSRKREQKYFDGWLETEYQIRNKGWRYAEKMYTRTNIITFFAQSSLVLLSIFLWRANLVTAGTIVLVISYSGTLFSRLSGIGSAVRRFFESYTDATEFINLISEDIGIKDEINSKPLHVTEGKIVFNNVSFAYKQGRDIFKDFNFIIESGEKVGIVGTSGAGKSTITKLLLRFADVTGGSITIDGQDIRNVTQDDLRSVISYVPQDPILFHRSLKENIAYGKPLVTEEEIIEASEKAHAHEFIKGLKHGYDTLVGERGVKLSGGERQRVALARAILKNSKVLVLDEATSALDSVSEEYIQQALTELMQNKTVIVIAHRLSTIQKLDRIVVMEEGRIIEEGSHKELLKRKGTYANFWNRQAGGFIE